MKALGPKDSLRREIIVAMIEADVDVNLGCSQKV
ncbi:MAG: hypothetical protein USCAAHI_02964 [Beijerinckiaceae bacterium]|jgi:hypothetical protein|nr:MAG: hypothetical protein USCAAHI_02964 [Beijerinckiaceae bacterium]